MFEDFEVIATYTDANAVDDGFLVEVGKRDRVTRTVFEYLAANANIATAEPPKNWPVAMMGWFKAGSISKTDALKFIAKHGQDAQKKFERQVRDQRAHALAEGLIGNHGSKAKRVYDQNIDGGILSLFPKVVDGKFTELSEVGSDSDPNRLWLIPNENGGTTLMFPSDY